MLMKKIKYYYNTNTLRYEKLETPLRVKLLRVFGFIAAALVTAALISYIAFQFIGSPKEKILEQQNKALRNDVREMGNELKSVDQRMGELEKRDNEVYRVIFESKPIKDRATARELLSGSPRLDAPADKARVEPLGPRQARTREQRVPAAVRTARPQAAPLRT